MMNLKSIKWKNYINYFVISVLTIVLTFISLDGGIKVSSLYLLERISYSIILAVSLSMVVGFLGELSLGHAGFMCVGAYLGGKVSALLNDAGLLGKSSLINLVISLIVGGIAAAICGFLIGLPALRLKGDYLAIVTLAFGEIVRAIFMNSSSESFGGSLGLKTPRFDRNYLFIVGFVLVLVCLFVIQNIIRSKHGRAITAIRDNEIAAKATGINVTKYKLSVFIVSAFFAGIAGVLYSFAQFTIQSTNFSYNYSIEILVMVVLGGIGSVRGSVIAAALIAILPEMLRSLQDYRMLIYAIVLIVMMLFTSNHRCKAIV